MLLMVQLTLPQSLVSSGASPFTHLHMFTMLLSGTWFLGQTHSPGLLVSIIRLPGQLTNGKKYTLLLLWHSKKILKNCVS